MSDNAHKCPDCKYFDYLDDIAHCSQHEICLCDIEPCSGYADKED